MEHMDVVPQNKMGPKKIDWPAILDEVRKNRGRWAKVGLFSPSAATQIRNGKWPAIDPKEFVITTRKDKDAPNRSWLYIKVREKGE